MLLMLCTRVKFRSISNTYSSFGLSKVEWPSKGLSSDAMGASSWAAAVPAAARLSAVAPSAPASVMNSRRFIWRSPAQYPVEQVGAHVLLLQRKAALLGGKATQQEPVIPV